MYTYTVNKVTTEYSITDDEHFTDVSIDIFKNGETFGTKKFGYSLDKTKEFIFDDLDKVMETLKSDDENTAKSFELDKILTDAQNLNKELLQ